MSKILVETTGNFQLVDLTANAKLIRHEGYTLIEQSPYLSERIGNGQLRLVAEVNDEATDADWLDTVKESEGDLDLALGAFKSEFPAGGVREPKPASNKKQHKETAAEKAAREAAEKEAADKAAAEKAAAEKAAAEKAAADAAK